MITVCSQFATVTAVKGLGVSISHDFSDDGQLVSGWVMVKEHCTVARHR